MVAAFFDLDKTVIARSAMAALSRPLLDAGMINRRLMLRGAWTQMLFHRFGADDDKMQQYREAGARITRGWEQARVRAIVAETLIDVIEPIVYREALELIADHRAAGHRVFIVSASPEEIVAPLASYLGVDDHLASRACIDAEGRYTGEVEFYCYGPSKVSAMEEIARGHGIDLAASFAYSDSITDLPMLAAVGHPTAVNPDRDLAREAGSRGWEIRKFDHPVPLRSRVPLPESRLSGVVAALVVLGGLSSVGALLWRRYQRNTTAALVA